MSTDVADMEDIARLRRDLESQIVALRCTQGLVPDDVHATIERAALRAEALHALALEALNRCTAIEERLDHLTFRCGDLESRLAACDMMFGLHGRHIAKLERPFWSRVWTRVWPW